MFKNVKKELIAIPAQMSYLSQVRDFIEHIGRKYKYSDKVTNSFKLVIEEACTNIIRHGYRDIKGGEITIKAIIRRQSLTIVIIDQGISYDPRQATTPDLNKYIQIGKKGGLGIFMMRKLMDDVQYNITNRGNELRLTKQREFMPQSRPQAWWEGLTMRTRHTIQAAAAVSVIAVVVFSILYGNVESNTFNNVVESTRAQLFALADNSSDPLQTDNDLELFAQTRSIKINNPGLIYETFIIDNSLDIVSASTAMKALGKYSIPDNAVVISDTVFNYSIFQYTVEDTLPVYDFKADIFAGNRGQSPVVGSAHIWVPVSYIESRTDSTRLNIILYMSVIIIVTLVGTYFLIDRIVAPFHSLADWVHQVGQGTVDEDEIDIDASDELGEIAQAFNMMTNKFREAQVSLIEQQRLQKELQVAQEIQQMLLPSDFPQVQGYELASFYEAAKEVGGDLFDFVEVDSDTIGICVADVAGKGVPGSLIMTMIRTALRLEARGNKNPADVLAKVNRFVTDDMKRGMFVTMFYLVLDSRNRIIHYASAGHNPMILYRGNTKQTYYLNPSGFPVGIQLPDITLFDRKIEQDSIRLREDDLLVLYTDGVTEAMNAKRDLYREERFLDAIRQNAHFDVSDFIKSVRDDIKHHTQGYPQNDDITYVAVKEKLMQGEVIYSIQKELFRLIEEEGISVKDACDKMQVSPYMYRKYKKIKEDVGWEGLKDLLYSDDFIEKKHLSIETKTKIYDVIRNYPEYGAKRISDELNTEKYSFTVLEPRRIYEELRKSKLSTREQRENYLKRGDKKRIKLPGTPLLTLDGQTILDYESAEQVIAKKRGKAASLPASQQPFPEEKKTESKAFHISSSSKPAAETSEEEKRFEDESETESKQAEVKEESVPVDAAAEPEQPAAAESPEIIADEIKSGEEKQIDIESEADTGPTDVTEVKEESIPVEAATEQEQPDAAEPPEIIADEIKSGEEKQIEIESEADTEPTEVKEESIPVDPAAEPEQPAADQIAAAPPEIITGERPDEIESDIEKSQEEKISDEKKATSESAEIKQALIYDKSVTEEKIKESHLKIPVVKTSDDDEIIIDQEPVGADQKKGDKPSLEPVVPVSKGIPASLRIPSEDINPDDVKVFYKMIKDDIQIIDKVRKSWTDGQINTEDMDKILISLRILTTHPLLKKIDNVKQLFTQVQKTLVIISDNLDEFDQREAIRNAKEMLKYIEKENILNNSKSILEQINEIGIRQQKLKSRFLKKSKEPISQLEAIRKKITQKNLIKNVSILESLSKSDRE